MKSLIVSLLVVAVVLVATDAQTQTENKPEQKEAKQPVVATVTSNLKSAKGQIRQFVLDGDETTFFQSDTNPQKDDHLTLTFDQPVMLTSVRVLTGQEDSKGGFAEGDLEVSTDGTFYRRASKFEGGKAGADSMDQRVVSVRIKSVGQDHPLIVREVAIKSTPEVATFRYPVEFIVNSDDAPDMKAWAEKAAAICERAYSMINDELRSEGFRPTNVITMTLKNDYQGVAATSRYDIVGSVKFFRAHKDDVGAMVHETIHCVQRWKARGFPVWLVEGVADYVRFFKFEPGKLGRIDPKTARYNASYRTSASFLAFIVEKYDREAILKLSALLRNPQETYSDAVFERMSGKTMPELEAEWRATLR